MRSICIKTNNINVITYLINKLSNIKIDNIYYSCKQFKIYKNIIIHFKGKNENYFLNSISKILANLVIDLYEKNIIRNLIKHEYFYFNQFEQNKIFNIAINDLYNKHEALYPQNRNFKIISNEFYKYLKFNNSLILTGFITFRLKKYNQNLLEQIDKSVTKFIINKEYNEFISLLKIYINTEKSTCNVAHLIYSKSNSILLDENKNIIKSHENNLNAKFLSDISFSSNDYTLNTLLSILPQKIYLHIIDKEDEFINTLKLVFENRIIYCKNCKICNFYKMHKSQLM